MADEAGEQTGGAKPPFDDQPETAANQPPELRAPLAPFAGEPPPAPAWFDRALAHAPERVMVPTPRGRIETLSWGERGKPGLLFVHGNTAHADWWSFIAPMFADNYRVCAMSLAGMGDSDWRERYSADDFVADAEAAAQASGLHASGRKPVYIGHSFGGGQVFYAAARRPEQMQAAIIVDVGFRVPSEDEASRAQTQRPDPPPPNRGPTRVYPTLQDALARFRLAPTQPADNLYIVDLLARRGLKQVEGGWTWKFDPQMWNKMDRALVAAFYAVQPRIDLPLAHIYGELSQLGSALCVKGAYPANGLVLGVPEAHHHVMVDQPLALVTAIRGLLAAWRA